MKKYVIRRWNSNNLPYHTYHKTIEDCLLGELTERVQQPGTTNKIDCFSYDDDNKKFQEHISKLPHKVLSVRKYEELSRIGYRKLCEFNQEDLKKFRADFLLWEDTKDEIRAKDFWNGLTLWGKVKAWLGNKKLITPQA